VTTVVDAEKRKLVADGEADERLASLAMSSEDGDEDAEED
jgi:hypothetical protein